MEYQIILASGSPRRKELLELIGVEFKIITSNKEEIITSTNPEEVVKELSIMKAEDVAAGVKGPAVILGADTVVVHGGRILGKPKDKEDARRMMHLLSGKTHQVITGVCLMCKEETRMFASVADVTFSEMSEAEIEDYISKEEPYDKAGAYALPSAGQQEQPERHFGR